jgi:hypothetical protein
VDRQRQGYHLTIHLVEAGQRLDNQSGDGGRLSPSLDFIKVLGDEAGMR